MTGAGDPPQRFVAGTRPVSALGFQLGAVIGVLGGVALILAALVFPGTNPDGQMIGGAAFVVVFAALGVIMPKVTRRKRREIVVFSPEGALDTRMAERPLPWSSITRIYDLPEQHMSWLVMETTAEAFAETRPKHNVSRRVRSVSFGVSNNALAIMPVGLDRKSAEIHAAADAFWHAYKGP